MVDASEGEYSPGEGPAAKVSAAVERQIERDLLEEALEANETEAGPISQEL